MIRKEDIKTEIIDEKIFNTEFIKILREILKESGLKYLNVSVPNFDGISEDCVFYAKDDISGRKVANVLEDLWDSKVFNTGRIYIDLEHCPVFVYSTFWGEYSLVYLRYIVYEDRVEEIVKW